MCTHLKQENLVLECSYRDSQILLWPEKWLSDFRWQGKHPGEPYLGKELTA